MPKNDKPRTPKTPVDVLPTVLHAAQGHDAAVFLKEVDDALHEDRLLAMWKKWRWVLMGVIAFLVVFTAGWQGWGAYVRHRDRTMAEAWYAFSALKAEEQKAGLPDLLAQSRGGYKILAAFEQARLLAKTDGKGADRSYGLIYNDRSYPQWVRDLARFDAALVLLGVDDTLAQEHLNVLVQTGATAKAADLSPLYAPALELLGLLAERKGDLPTARGYAEKIVQIPNLPDDLRARAETRLGNLSTLGR